MLLFVQSHLEQICGWLEKDDLFSVYYYSLAEGVVKKLSVKPLEEQFFPGLDSTQGIQLILYTESD